MLMLHTTIWMNLTDTILSERIQTEKKAYYMRACKVEQVKPDIVLTVGWSGYLGIRGKEEEQISFL